MREAMCSNIIKKLSQKKIMTTQSQQCHQCSHYKKSYGLCSNSILDVRCELIGTKFAQNIEHRHARGNVQQYYQNLVMERNSDDSKLTTLRLDLYTERTF